MNQLKQIIAVYPRLFRGSPPVVHSYVNEGWAPIVSRMFARIDALLTDEQAAAFRVIPLKEKFGQFRISYVAGAIEDERKAAEDDDPVDILSADGNPLSATGARKKPPALFDDDLKARIRELVEDAIKEASVTCEYCSSPGRLLGDSWVATLCDDHDRMRRQRTGPWSWGPAVEGDGT